MTENIPEVPALDDLSGDEIEAHIGGPVEPDHDVDVAAGPEAGEGDE